MALTEIERAEMVNELSAAVSPKTTESLMKCVLPDGRDHLATKDDVKAVENSLRADFADLRADFADLRTDFAELKGHVDSSLADIRRELAEMKGHLDSTLAKHTRLHYTTLVGFMLTTWGAMFVHIAA